MARPNLFEESGTCKYFVIDGGIEARSGHAHLGECHRYAPKGHWPSNMDESDFHYQWPYVWDADGCGEWVEHPDRLKDTD
jgi:hypothetical protein